MVDSKKLGTKYECDQIKCYKSKWPENAIEPKSRLEFNIKYYTI